MGKVSRKTREPSCPTGNPVLMVKTTGFYRIFNYILVGGFNPPEKYEFVSWDYYSQYMEKIKAMFQTTNQTSHEKNRYPLVNAYLWKDPPFFMGKLTINCHFQ